MIEIKTNFLNDAEHQQLLNTINHMDFPWYWHENASYTKEDNS